MRRIGWMLILVLALAACGGNDSSPTPTPSRTPFEPTPLPPTWTPTPAGFVPSPTATIESAEPAEADNTTADAVSGQLQGGQGFPPTWTPGPAPQRPTVTPRPTLPSSGGAAGQSSGSSNLLTGSPAPTWTPQPEYCYELQAIGGDIRSYVGHAVTLAWKPISVFDNYLVEVRHPGGSVVHSAIAPGGSYEIPGEVFTQANVYGWEVSAVDENGNRVCFPISGEIITSFP